MTAKTFFRPFWPCDRFDGTWRNRISLSVYSWGEIQRAPKVGSLLLEEFSWNFYGYVSGTPTFN
jgi:hypothetical protein